MFVKDVSDTFTVELDADACVRIARACERMGQDTPCGADGPAYEALTALFAAASTATALHGMMVIDPANEATLARIHTQAHGTY